jgi:hypothetical protein
MLIQRERAVNISVPCPGGILDEAGVSVVGIKLLWAQDKSSSISLGAVSLVAELSRCQQSYRADYYRNMYIETALGLNVAAIILQVHIRVH